MGLINRNGYTVKGVEIKPAYTKIMNIEIYTDGNRNTVSTEFGISTTRENLNNNLVLTYVRYECEFDRAKDQIFADVYTKAKADIFKG